MAPIKDSGPPSREHLALFIARLQHLLASERAAEEEQTRLLNSKCSHKLLEQKGLALGGLGVAGVSLGLGGKSLVELVRPTAYHTSPLFPSHTFRNGDPARLEAFNPKGDTGKKGKGKASASSGAKDGGKEDDAGAVECIIYRVSSEKIVLAVEGEVDVPERLRLIKLANSVTFDRMDKTVARLEKDVNAHTESPVARALLGIDAPTQHPVEEPIWLTQLNDSQKDAIRFCLGAYSVACIHGPPGTGKTHTLVELIYQLLSRPASVASDRPPRILVCTPSNLALDNILLRLYILSGTEPYAKLLPRSAIVRVGHPTRVHRDLIGVTLDYKTRTGDSGALVRDIGREIDEHLSNLTKKRGERGAIKGRERGKTWDEVRALRKDYKVREGKVVGEVMAGAQVVLATCHSAGSRMLGNSMFDVCIIDEATQAVEPVCWVPVMKSRKVILAGDPQQLPPTIKTKGEAGGVKGKGKKKVKNGDKTKTAIKKSGQTEPAADDSDADELGESGTEQDQAVQAVQDGSHGLSETAESGSPESDITIAARAEDIPSGAAPPAPNSTAEGTSSGTSLAISADGNAPAKPSSAEANVSPHPALNPRSLEETLFDRLERTYPSTQIKRVLKVQYRMHADIASFPSDELYESALVSHESVASHTLRDILPPLEEQGPEGAKDEEDLDIPPVVFYDTAGCEFYERSGSSDEPVAAEGGGKGKGGGVDDESKSNANEAVICAKWARHLISLGLPPGDIGIVTPYQAQVSLLSESLSELVAEGLTIGSVDGLQGQEREAVILSLVRSNAEGEIGFLGEYRRMNVGMTRAKRHLCVVGDSATVGKKKKGYLGKWMGWLEENAEVRFAGDEA